MLSPGGGIRGGRQSRRGAESEAMANASLAQLLTMRASPRRGGVAAVRPGLVVEPFEPVSPELVLVSPELRTLAVGGLLEADGSPPEHGAREAAPGKLRLAARLAVYAAWQALIGALLGAAAFAAFAALLVAVSLLAR